MKHHPIIRILQAVSLAIIALLGMRALFTTHTTLVNSPASSKPRQRGIPQLTWVLVIVVVGLIVIWTMPSNPTGAGVITIATTDNIGYFNSIALDSNGIPVIAYYDRTNNDLKLARCNNATTCDAPTIITLDSTDEPGWGGISLALTASDVPIVAYVETINADLKLAMCDTPTCAKVTIYTVDSANAVVQPPSLQLTSGGVAVIAYYENTHQALKLAHCNTSTTCDSPTAVNAAASTGVAQWISLRLNNSDAAFISYFASSGFPFRFTYCDTISCASPIFRTLDNTSEAGYYSSIRLYDGIPVLVYYVNSTHLWKLRTCNDATCSTSTVQTLQITGNRAAFGIDSSGFPIIAEQTGDDLSLARCYAVNCPTPIMTVLDGGAPVVGAMMSIALDGSLPIISYYDQTNGDLKLYNARLNVSPTLVNNSAQSVAIHGTITLSPANLSFTDADNAPATSLIYTVITNPTQGTLPLSRFTQAQIDGNAVFYQHTGTGNDSFTFIVSDGIAVLGPYTFNLMAVATTYTPSPTTTSTTTATATRTPTQTPFATPTETPAPPLQCTLITVSNVFFSGNQVMFEINNRNVFGTRVKRTILNWNPIVDDPGMVMAQMSVDQSVYWQGTDTQPPTDTSNDAGFINSADPFVSGGGISTWKGVFINGPSDLSVYYTAADFAGTTFYFLNPNGGPDCVVTLNGAPAATYTASITYTPAPTLTPSITRTSTLTAQPTLTPTITQTITSTPTRTLTPTRTFTPTNTPVPEGVFRTLDVDSAGEVSSLELDNRIPVIAYIGNGSIRLIRCNNTPYCDNPLTVTIDTMAQYSSMELDSAGIPVMSYYDTANQDLKFARCGDPNCSTVNIRTLDSVGNVGAWSTIVLDSSGIPTIIYLDITGGDLKLARCNNNTTCDAPTFTIIDNGIPTSQPGLYNSMVMDSNDRPIIIYRDSATLAIKIVFCNNPTCSSATSSLTDSQESTFTSMRLDRLGRPVITYYSNNGHSVVLLRCNSATDCTSSTHGVVSSGIGQYPSLALDANDFPVVSYLHSDEGDLRLSRCTDPYCGGTVFITTLDSVGNTGWYSSIELDEGYPVISYKDDGLGDLRYYNAHPYVPPTSTPTLTYTPTVTPTATMTPTPTVTPAATSISENEFFAAVVDARQGYPDIITIVPDFVPNAINMTVAINGGMVGSVTVEVTQGEDFVTFDITSITVNGAAAPQSYITIVNRDLPGILTTALDNIITARFGATTNVHTLILTGDAIIVTLNSE